MGKKYEVSETWNNKIQGAEVTDVWFDEYFNELCGGNFTPVINPPMEKTNGNKKQRRRHRDDD